MITKKKLAIITTHPIQYYAPLFRELNKSEKLELKVFYTKGKSETTQFEPDFGKSIAWDIPLLEGYTYEFVENINSNQEGFQSIKNPDLISKIKDWGAQAILVFGWSYHSHLQAMRHFKRRIPVLFRGDSNLLDKQSGSKTLLRRFLLTWVYSHIDKALYVGEANKKYYLKHGLKPKQLTFAPHAIDNLRFTDVNNEFSLKAQVWRHELGIQPHEKAILFVGKFISKKNPLLLLNAFKSINAPNTHLIFVGNGELEKEMKSLALGWFNIHFIPFQNQSLMPVVYRLADIFCLPSQGPGETWGLAVNEAMASGCALLVSDKCGCASDLVQNDWDGYIFESRNIEQLTEAMRKLFSKDLSTFKNNSLSLISNYNFHAISNALETIV